MNILILGDIVGKKTVEYLSKNLWSLRKEKRIDMVIANGENATDIMGLAPDDAKALLDGGVDVITSGNHIFHNRALYQMLDDSRVIIRPLNAPAAAPGCGETVFEACGYNVLVLNVLGMMGMEYAQNPFEAVDKALHRMEGRYDFAIVDIHAEATAEKQAMGYYLAGRAAAVVGTHTHVQTADARVLEGGTAYITDLGMCGPEGGILGTDKNVILKRFTTGLPQKFTVADGEIKLSGVVVTVENNRAINIEKI
ncbi:MAG: TIGR00282 family metallophosphoesterase [Ruminococcaceae bacterium]|nr:TIGR00282 family metallophosphoesterase [Oscillospiraceae bacterium]